MMLVRLLGLAGLLLLLAGCSGRDSRLASVSGVVYLNGEPLSGARVYFKPILPDKELFGPGSMGITDSAGRFRLRTIPANQDGALIGSHTVQVSLPEKEATPDQDIPLKEMLPARYNTKSKMTYEVPRGGANDVKFELKKP
jgi:hypothetical protein